MQFVMVGRVRADRERQPMVIHNRHDFHAFSALRWSDFQAATFGHDERFIDEQILLHPARPSAAKLVGQTLLSHPTQNLVAAPSLKASMYSFRRRIVFAVHVPLRPGVEESTAPLPAHDGCVRLASSTPIGKPRPWELLPNALPNVRLSAESFLIYSGSTAAGILR